MKLNHRAFVVVWGLVWVCVGVALLNLGLNLILQAIRESANVEVHYLLAYASRVLGGVENGALALIVSGLFVGFIKGRYALGKAVQKSLLRLRSYPNPCTIANLYSIKDYLIIATMMCLGFIMRYFQVASEVRGTILVLVGTALLNGATLFFRAAMKMRKAASQENI